MARALELHDVVQPENMATQIAMQYTEWSNMRAQWLEMTKEVRDYIFATDTHSTSNNVLPWKNSVHIPKLCQIRDNLHANYMAALFPNDRSIQWEGDDENAESLDKRRAVEAFMENKIRQSQLRTEVSKTVYDFIDYGNAFGMTEYVAEETEDLITGEKVKGYIGPKMVRISPLDIVFNPIARNFAETPKIIREIKTLGSIHSDVHDHPELKYQEAALGRSRETRHKFSGMAAGDVRKNDAFHIDGFSSYMNYMQSDYVELLHFYGDFYDRETGDFYKNHVITVIDRAYVLRSMPNPSWLGTGNIFHVGWRLRPDNLYAMGPLENLVGMQYRINHLENAKSDAFDLIIHPVMKVKGYVEDFDYGPGERVFVGDEGDVEFMRPDTTMLNADTQIQLLEAKMEEMAGAPKQAMGFRTPGEKTAYEVQVLENGANRVFLNKTSYFEEIFLEPILNSMLEISRRNMGSSEAVRVLDDQFGSVDFMKVTREDITSKGKIRPIGARHFARNANIVQNLTQLSQTMGQDAAIMNHISGLAMAGLLEELLNLDRFKLVKPNIRITEQLESQQLLQSAQQIAAEQMAPSNANAVVQPPQV